MIIFGWTTRTKPTARHGQFYCPHCRVSSTYSECRQRTRFHLFFIPVITVSDDPGGVQCCHCKTFYDEEVLQQAPRQKLASWDCPQCGRSWPETNVRCPFCKVRLNGTPT